MDVISNPEAGPRVPKAYVISEVAVLDEAKTARYRHMAAASIEAYGGCYLVRGAEIITLEGSESGARLVVVEFPSMQQAKAWYGSAEYAPARALRETALERRLLLVEGYDVMAPPANPVERSRER